jgi:hypothetical protein
MNIPPLLSNIALVLVLTATSYFYGANSLTPPDHQRCSSPSPSDQLCQHQLRRPSTSTSRRDVFTSLLPPVARSIILATMLQHSSSPANAFVEECKPKSHNCIRTQWTAPSYITKPSEVATILRELLNSYPTKGQSGVDCNGWTVVNDNVNEDTSIITLGVEYKSCVGPAALAINFGQPFIDDLKLEVTKNSNTIASSSDDGGRSGSGSIVVDVKSSSRMGSSDLFVNRKRLEYLGNILRERGWDVPPPKYVYEK